MRFAVASLAVAACLLVAPGARAQVDSREGIALQNEIYQLRSELRNLEDQIARNAGSTIRPQYAPAPSSGGGTGDLVAQLLTRVDTLEDQVRTLRGRVDELQNQLTQQNADLNKKIDDLAFQINPNGATQAAPAVEPGAQPGAQPGPQPDMLRPPAAPPAKPPAPRAPRTPEIAMKEGDAALARRDYPAAEAAAREVLANRTSPRAYDARLLLAQALAGEKQYAQAAIAYDDTYNSSRKGSHAQQALLGLASSLTMINEKKAACDTLARLHADFPQLRSDVASGAASIGQKAGCR